jgi:hypothetical protein
MPNNNPPIDNVVDEKIDEKIEKAQLQSPVMTPGDQAIRDRQLDAKMDSKIADAQIPVRDNVPSTTTLEEDRQSKGQRDIRHTQSLLAIFVVVTCLVVSAAVVILATIFRIMGIVTVLDSLALAAFTSLSSLASLVIGFYFGSKLATDKSSS